MNEVLSVIRSRRSVRRYRPDPIPEETLNRIIEAGLWAPSACNEQSWHFTVVTNRELIDRMSAVSKEAMLRLPNEMFVRMAENPDFHVFYHAPVVVVVSGRRDAVSPLVDCSAAIENMILAAASLGIGSCWIGLVRGFLAVPQEVAKLGIPEGYEPYYAVCLGYSEGPVPADGPERKAPPVRYIR